ncbi:MAG: helix-turn-helix transcriptional regulator [Chloroflexota bacterium]
MALRSEVLSELRGAVGFDAYVWLLTDPGTFVGCSPLADVPVDDLPALIAAKYLTEVNRWTRLASGHTSAASLLGSTRGKPEESLVWREILASYRVVDVASAVFTDRHGSWGFVDLWRIAPASPFEADVIELLEAVVPAVTNALRRAQAATFGEPAVTVPRDQGPVVLLLDGALHVVDQTTAAGDWLRVLVPSSPGAQPIPAAAYNVGAQLIAVERGVDGHEPRARVHLAGGFWVTLRAGRLGGADGPTDAAIAVTIEEASSVDRLEVFGRASALSRRERELLTLLGEGAATTGLAARMFVTEHTVQDHLKSIFDKTSTHSRRELLSRVLGTKAELTGS